MLIVIFENLYQQTNWHSTFKQLNKYEHLFFSFYPDEHGIIAIRSS